MRCFQRQKNIENKVYECIEDIANELNLKVPFYPEVYWVGRNFKIEKIGFSKKVSKWFNDNRKYKIGVFNKSKNTILISEERDIDISEEAGHFLHKVNSNPNGVLKKDSLNIFFNRIIEECVGYFSSKLLVPNRKSLSWRYKDRIPYNSQKKQEFFQILKKQLELEESKFLNYQNFLIYQQGYGLGERLFNSYVCGETNKGQIKRLICNPLKEKNAPIKKFLDLKQKYWPPKESNKKIG